MSRVTLRILNTVGILLAFGVMLLGASMGRADTLDDIYREVKPRIAYQRMGWAADKYAPAETVTIGNCLTYARTFKTEAAKAGIYGTIRHCVLWNGGEHAYFKAADGRVLDNRLMGVVSEEDVGCVRMLSDIN